MVGGDRAVIEALGFAGDRLSQARREWLARLGAAALAAKPTAMSAA
jgi:hypothetical protein